MEGGLRKHWRLFVIASLFAVGAALVGCSGDGSADAAGNPSANPVVSGAQSAESTTQTGVTPGKLARDFTLESLDGSQVSLSDYRGQVVLVNFWATWCPPCRAEIPDLEAAYQAHRQDGFVILGVDVEDPRHLIESFLDEVEMTYPILLDEAGRTSREYRAPGLPMTLLLDREGVIQVRHAGYISAEQLSEYLEQVLPLP